MKKKFAYLLAVCAAMLPGMGCISGPAEYYEELTVDEQRELLNDARGLAMRSKAVPAHLQTVFKELTPYTRIVYSGNKRGKATFRWEIYENVSGKRITQQDINPYWIMVYATGNLRDPQWKLSFANKDITAEGAERERAAEREQRRRRNHQVRYKR